MSTETSRSEHQREKNILEKKIEHNNHKHKYNRNTEREEKRKKKTQEIFEIIMTENFPKLVSDTNHTQI